MNLYLLNRLDLDDDQINYNIYLAMVVASESPEQAKMLNPDSGKLFLPHTLNYTSNNNMVGADPKPDYDDSPCAVDWPAGSDKLEVIHIGTSELYDKPTVILTDFVNCNF